MNKLIILIVAFTMCSCEREIKPIINDNCFTTSLLEETSVHIYGFPRIDLTRNHEHICIVKNVAGFYDGENRFMYTWNKKHHYVPENDLEIVFTRDRYCPEYGLKPENCLIGAKLINDKLMAYYILWQNRGKKPELDSNKSYSRYFSHFYDKEKDSTIIEFHSMLINYPWEISELTDTIVTNLSFDVIKKLYPKFKGKLKQVAIDTIFLNYDLSVETYDFYSDIKLKDNELGYSRNYKKLQKFIKNKQKYLP